MTPHDSKKSFEIIERINNSGAFFADFYQVPKGIQIAYKMKKEPTGKQKQDIINQLNSDGVPLEIEDNCIKLTTSPEKATYTINRLCVMFPDLFEAIKPSEPQDVASLFRWSDSQS